MDLRERLDELTDNRRSFADYKIAIDELNAKANAQIKIVPSADVPEGVFNCHAFALRLFETPEYARLYEKHGQKSALVSGCFVSSLIARDILKRTTEKADAIRAYAVTGRITHTGIVEVPGQRILSKWGTWEVHSHPVKAVPSAYGYPWDFFEPPESDEILALLDEWCGRRAVPL